MTQSISIALIYGSTRSGRFCDTVVQWAAGEVARHGDFSLDIIDPAGLISPTAHKCKDRNALMNLTERIEQAEAFVVVTPEYNHGYPAPLKFLIDSVYAPWQAKPVAFVSYGGISGGLRAVEQLRLVFAELHAVTIRDTVSFAHAWEQFGEDGRLLEPARARKSMTALLTQLKWWALALRTARDAMPYGQVVA